MTHRERFEIAPQQDCARKSFYVTHLIKDQNPLVGNPLASGGKEFAARKRVGFVSYRKQNGFACSAISAVSSNGVLRVATVSAVSICQEKWAL